MKNFFFWVGLGGFILAGIVFSFEKKSPTVDSMRVAPEEIKKGAILFSENCSICHGPDGIGEDPARPMGGLKPDGSYIAPALNGTAHAWHHPDDMLFSIIKNGSKAESSSMRGFNGKLTNDEINLTMVYFQSLWPPKILRLRAQRLIEMRKPLVRE